MYELAKCGQGMLVKKDKFFSYEDLGRFLCYLIAKRITYLNCVAEESRNGGKDLLHTNNRSINTECMSL